MEEEKIKVIERQCDSCGKSFKVKVVMPGRYKVSCPKCRSYVRFVVTKQELPGRMLMAPRLVLPELGKAEKVQDKFYVIKKRAVVHRLYKATCPDCGEEITLSPHETGKVLRAKCEKCGTIVAYKAVELKR